MNNSADSGDSRIYVAERVHAHDWRQEGDVQPGGGPDGLLALALHLLVAVRSRHRRYQAVRHALLAHESLAEVAQDAAQDGIQQQ